MQATYFVKKLETLYNQPDTERNRKILDKFEDNIKKLFIAITYLPNIRLNEADSSIKKKLIDEDNTILYMKVFECVHYIIDTYRHYHSHIGHAQDTLDIRKRKYTNIKLQCSDEEYQYIVTILKMYYQYKIYNAFNNNDAIKYQYSNAGIQFFQPFYIKENNVTQLSRDGPIFILSFILPKHHFTELLSSCTGYKKSEKQPDDNELTPFHKKRNYISRFSMPPHDTFFTFPLELEKYLSHMSTASKVSYEIYQYYPDMYTKMIENTSVPISIQKQNTFTQYAVRYIEDRKLFSKIHFIHRDTQDSPPHYKKDSTRKCKKP